MNNRVKIRVVMLVFTGFKERIRKISSRIQ